MKKLLALVMLLPMLAGCATAHHVATVTVVSGHSTIATVQDFADKITCGHVGAPDPCLPVVVREGKVSKALAEALEVDIAMLKAVRDWPGPPAKLVDVTPYLTKISDLLKQVVEAIPDGAAKQRLLQLIGGK